MVKKLMIKDVEKLHKKYNNKYFDGQLSDIKIIFFNSIRANGSYNFMSREIKTGNPSRLIKLNHNLRMDEEFLTNVLLHEMIHQYEAEVLKIYPSHKNSFINKMNELNTFGHDITIKSDTTTLKGNEFSVIILKNIKNNFHVVFYGIGTATNEQIQNTIKSISHRLPNVTYQLYKVIHTDQVIVQNFTKLNKNFTLPKGRMRMRGYENIKELKENLLDRL